MFFPVMFVLCLGGEGLEIWKSCSATCGFANGKRELNITYHELNACRCWLEVILVGCWMGNWRESSHIEMTTIRCHELLGISHLYVIYLFFLKTMWCCFSSICYVEASFWGLHFGLVLSFWRGCFSRNIKWHSFTKNLKRKEEIINEKEMVKIQKTDI